MCVCITTRKMRICQWIKYVDGLNISGRQTIYSSISTNILSLYIFHSILCTCLILATLRIYACSTLYQHWTLLSHQIMQIGGRMTYIFVLFYHNLSLKSTNGCTRTISFWAKASIILENCCNRNNLFANSSGEYRSVNLYFYFDI